MCTLQRGFTKALVASTVSQLDALGMSGDTTIERATQPLLPVRRREASPSSPKRPHHLLWWVVGFFEREGFMRRYVLVCAAVTILSLFLQEGLPQQKKPPPNPWAINGVIVGMENKLLIVRRFNLQTVVLKLSNPQQVRIDGRVVDKQKLRFGQTARVLFDINTAEISKIDIYVKTRPLGKVEEGPVGPRLVTVTREQMERLLKGFEER